MIDHRKMIEGLGHKFLLFNLSLHAPRVAHYRYENMNINKEALENALALRICLSVPVLRAPYAMNHRIMAGCFNIPGDSRRMLLNDLSNIGITARTHYFTANRRKII